MSSRLRVGEWIEVRSKDEILRTLDGDGSLEGLPFMPEMFAFCGRRFRVYKRAHKTCDTVFPIRGRKMERTVHLETRCSGEAHGGCEARCLLFWKEAWLRRVGVHEALTSPQKSESGARCGLFEGAGCTEADVRANTVIARDKQDGETRYVCQNTQVPYATSPLPWWDLRQYVEDYFSGNVGIWRLTKGAIYSGYYNLSQAGIGVGSLMRWVYDTFHPLWRGTLWPRRAGAIPASQPTPTEVLDLKPGELVRVKSHKEILETLNMDSKNRGMYWDAEMVPYCGRTYRVLKRVTRIIDEKTGKLISMKNPCIILDTVVCTSRYSYCRMFCPRAFHPYWREIWLERVAENTEASNNNLAEKCA